MTEFTLENGFKAKVDENLFDDMRFIDLLAGLEEKPLTIGKVAETLLGKAQKEALYKHIEADGKVSVEAFTACITEIMEKCASGKKS